LPGLAGFFADWACFPDGKRPWEAALVGPPTAFSRPRGDRGGNRKPAAKFFRLGWGWSPKGPQADVQGGGNAMCPGSGGPGGGKGGAGPPRPLGGAQGPGS